MIDFDFTENQLAVRDMARELAARVTVSYTHLTLPTN